MSCFGSPFKFEHMWFRHPHFQSFLRQWWVSAPACSRTKMFQFFKKLQFIKVQAKEWNRKIFKNVFAQKKIIAQQLEEVNQNIISKGLNQLLHSTQKALQSEWEESCKREKEYWKQKSRELWLKQGDKNTKFFHASTKQRKASNVIFSIKHVDTWVLIKNLVDNQDGVKFCKNLLAPPLSNLDPFWKNNVELLLQSIPPLISDQDNKVLLTPFTVEEVYKVVFSLSPDKAPGPDGFAALFFQKCWDVIGFNLLAIMEESNKRGEMLKSFNATNIVLIPKIPSPSTFVEFRPISLCNTIYKIITKAIYLRMHYLIPKIISQEQGGFVLGRETMEGALVAHEVLHSIHEN